MKSRKQARRDEIGKMKPGSTPTDESDVFGSGLRCREVIRWTSAAGNLIWD